MTTYLLDKGILGYLPLLFFCALQPQGSRRKVGLTFCRFVVVAHISDDRRMARYSYIILAPERERCIYCCYWVRRWKLCISV